MTIQQSKRLFIGGLFAEIKEDDVRDKFKSFGDISSVQIVRKKNEDGTVMKTFAYIDISCQESNLNKCLNIFNKSKWKGNVMSVQVAKEGFLGKLKKERDTTLKDTTTSASMVSTPPERKYNDLITKAQGTRNIPGKKIPGEDGWVIGKYGMVLPILKMKDRQDKKLISCDPSVNCHRVKRFKSDLGNDINTSIDDIDWNLENGTSKQDGASSVKASCTAIDVSTPYKRKGKANDFDDQSSPRKKKVAAMSSGSKEMGNNVNRSVLRNCKDLKDIANSVEEGHECVHGRQKKGGDRKKMMNKTKINNDDNVNMILNETGKQLDQSLASNNDTLGPSIMDEIRKRATPNQSDLGGEKVCEFNKSNCEPLDVETVAALDKSDDLFPTQSNVVMSDNVHTMSQHQNVCKISSPSVDNKITFDSTLNKETPSDYEGKSCQRRSLAEKRRQQSVDSRQSSMQRQHDMIQESLRNIDIQKKRVNHIKFSDDDDDKDDDSSDENDDFAKAEEEELSKPKASTGSGKISGQASLSWLGLDEELGDTNDEKEELIAVKPQFEGEKGRKLFQLQKSIGTDSRFKLDEKFLESDDESNEDKEEQSINLQQDSEKSALDDNDEAANSNDLQEERHRSLRILAQVLGSGISAAGENPEKRKTHGPVRYDPTDETHTQFEVQSRSKHGEEDCVEKKAAKVVADKDKDDRNHQTNTPEVTKDTYYSVSSSLKSLFGNEGSTTFTFLPPDEKELSSLSHDVDTCIDVESATQDSVKLPDWFTRSNDVLDNDDVIASDPVENTVVTSRFFFFEDDPRFKDILEGETFMRTESEDEIEKFWNEARRPWTEDYKRKHKDAIRWRKKISTRFGKRT